MVRLWAIAALFLSSTVWAGETSRYDVIGFSADGRYFAFEEYGVGDGAGIPYANVFVIDVETDRWVKGTPVRSNLTESDAAEFNQLGKTVEESEKLLLEAVRNDMKAKASKALALVSPSHRGIQRVHNPRSEFSAVPGVVRFSTSRLYDGYNRNISRAIKRLELEEIALPPAKSCYNQTEKMFGFRLSLIDEETGRSKQLHADSAVPKSRICPLAYRIEEVISHHPADEGPISLAILIRYAKPGYEGADGRLLAVTTRFATTQ